MWHLSEPVIPLVKILYNELTNNLKLVVSYWHT